MRLGRHCRRQGAETGRRSEGLVDGDAAAPLQASGIAVELPRQPVLPPGRKRHGIGAAIGAGFVVLIIIAAGLGLLGGKRAVTPTATGATDQIPTAVRSAFAGQPAVTPAVACQPAPIGIPRLELVVNGLPFEGGVYAVEWIGVTPPPLPALESEPPTASPRIDIRSDVVTELRAFGDECAVEWSIHLLDPSDTTLEALDNPARDPRLASQNRFSLPLSRFRGRDYKLEVTVTFPTVSVRASWEIRILPFEAPTPALTLGDHVVDLVASCDNRLTLDNGWTELVNPCTVPDRTPFPNPVARGDKLLFRFPRGWDMRDFGVGCDRVVDGKSEPCSDISWSVDGGRLETGAQSTTFEAPQIPGTYAFVMRTCGVQAVADVVNTLCGFWNATLEVRR